MNRCAPLAQFASNLPTPVCVRTLRKELHILGIGSRIAIKKPFLSPKHKVDRLEFAKQHLHWSMEDWSFVMWTDESSFEVGHQSRTIRVWQKPYEKYSWDCLAPTFKSGRTSIIIWGAFTSSNKSDLVLIPPNKHTALDFVDVVYKSGLESYYKPRTQQLQASYFDGGWCTSPSQHCTKALEGSTWDEEASMVGKFSKSKPN